MAIRESGSMLDLLADIVVPSRCAACEAHGDAICRACAAAFAAGGPVTRSAAADTPAVVALGAYAGKLARALRCIKFGGRRRAAIRLGELLCTMLAIPVDVIVAVPLHAQRLRQRGFNQAELVAASVAAGCAAPHLRGALRRAVNTRSQSVLPLEARRANVRGAFAAGANAAMVEDRRVLIVDDVVTTGATLAACAAALDAFRPRSIVGAAVALTL